MTHDGANACRRGQRRARLRGRLLPPAALVDALLLRPELRDDAGDGLGRRVAAARVLGRAPDGVLLLQPLGWLV